MMTNGSIETIYTIPAHLRFSKTFALEEDGTVLIFGPSAQHEAILYNLQISSVLSSRRIATGNLGDKPFVLLPRGEGGGQLTSQGNLFITSRGSAFDIRANRYVTVAEIRPPGLASNQRIGTMLYAPSNGCVYMFCHDGAVKCLDVRNPSCRWHSRPSMPLRTRTTMAAAECRGKIYILSGRRVACYQHGFWRMLPDLAVFRSRASVAVVNHYLVVVGGVDEETGNPITSIEVLNTLTDASEILADVELPRPRYEPSLIVYGGSIHVFGGGDADVIKIHIPQLHFVADEPQQPQQLPTQPQQNGQRAPSLLPGNQKPVPGNKGRSPSVAMQPGNMTVALPSPPVIPDMPTNTIAPSLQEHRTVLDEYIASLETLQSTYSEHTKQNEEQVLRALRQTHQLWNQQVEQRKQETLRRRQHLDSFIDSSLAMTGRAEKDRAAADVYGDGVPDFLRCPITLQVMEDPVVAADGNVYERSALLRWFSDGGCKRPTITSPVTGAPMANQTCFPCHTLRGLCWQYRESSAKQGKEP